MEVQAKWPSDGKINFEGVMMPYLLNSPPVLKGITFSIHPGKKIGVVCCTGAGKSSLNVALYRLAKMLVGRIEVDSIDCSFVNLNKLHSSMAIIPQELVMIGGTLCSNLDPFHQHDDEKLLEYCTSKCLLGPIGTNEGGLNA
jgi:ABC-type multidrug transport system fused ATPase/permease subunit